MWTSNTPNTHVSLHSDIDNYENREVPKDIDSAIAATGQLDNLIQPSLFKAKLDKFAVNVFFVLAMTLWLTNCSKEQFPLTSDFKIDNSKYKLPKETIPKDVYDIHKNILSCDIEQSEAAYEKLGSLDSSKYIQYINSLAYDGLSDYDISLDTAIYILAKRIDYSRYLFNKMPNKLSILEKEKVGTVMNAIGLPISVDPETWPSRYFHIEANDHIVGSDSICETSSHFKTIFYPTLKIENGKVDISGSNFTIQQMIDKGYITAKFDPASQYMLRIDINLSSLHMADIDYQFVLDNITKKYSY